MRKGVKTMDRNERDRKRKGEEKREPTIAPGMNTSDPLEENATEEEIEEGQYTEVTRLYIDRTPDD